MGGSRPPRYFQHQSYVYTKPHASKVKRTLGVVVGASTIATLYLFMLPNSKQVEQELSQFPGIDTIDYQEAAQAVINGPFPADTCEMVKLLSDFCSTFAIYLPGGQAYIDSLFDKFKNPDDRESTNSLLSEAYRRFKNIPQLNRLSHSNIDMACAILADLDKKLTTSLTVNPGHYNSIPPKDQTSDVSRYLMQLSKQIEMVNIHLDDLKLQKVGSWGLDEELEYVRQWIHNLGELNKEAWNIIIQEAMPYLEKNPKIREIVERNAGLLQWQQPRFILARIILAAEDPAVDEILQSKIDALVEDRARYIQDVKKLCEDADFAKFLQRTQAGLEMSIRIQLLQGMIRDRTVDGDIFIEKTIQEIEWLVCKKQQYVKTGIWV